MSVASYQFLAYLIPIGLFLLGLYLYSGRGAFLIAGYNTLPKAEQEKYDKKVLTRSVGIYLFAAAVLTAITLYFGFNGKDNVAMIGTVGMILLTIVWIVYVRTNKKIKPKND